MDMTLITGLFQSINAAKTLGEGLVATRDLDKLGAIKIEFQDKIIEIQNLVMSLQKESMADSEKISLLEKELARLKDWEAERQRYELREIAPGVIAGIVAYALRPTMRAGEPPHWLCATCFDSGRKSILQSNGGDHTEILTCGVCKNQLRIRHKTGPVSALPPSRPRGGPQGWMGY